MKWFYTVHDYLTIVSIKSMKFSGGVEKFHAVYRRNCLGWSATLKSLQKELSRMSSYALQGLQ